MKFKILIVLSLAAFTMLAGCRGTATNTNVNTNATVTATATPVVKTSETAATDMGMKTRIEDALKKKGYTDITVDTSTTPMTVRGTVAKDKLADAMSTITENNGGKPVTNQVTAK